MELKLKKYGLDKIILVVLAGILLLILAVPSGGSDGASGESSTEASYTEELEQRLVKILEKTYGEGTIDVMITVSDIEATYFEEGKESVEGVLVVAAAADDERAVADIISAVTALFDVPTHKVKVLKMN